MASTPSEKTPGQTPPSFPQEEGNLMQGQPFQPMEMGASRSHNMSMANTPIIVYSTSQPIDYKKYNHKVAFGLGLMQIACGIATILLQILAIIYMSDLAEVGTGIWTGIIFIVAGAFGMGSSQRKTKCFIITTMVMSIIAACMVAALVGLSAMSVAADADDYNYYYEDKASKGARISVNGIMLAVAIGELVIAILQAVFCCSVVCCGKSHTVITYGPANSGQSVMVPQTMGYPTPIMTTTSPLGQVVLAPQALGYPGSIITTTNPTTGTGHGTFGATTGIPTGSSQDPPSYEALDQRQH